MTLVRSVAGSAREHARPPDWLGRLLALGRPIVMGVLNVTPDSFSDGGRFLDPAAALDQARRMVAQGADILDIGADRTAAEKAGGDIPQSARSWPRSSVLASSSDL